MATVSLPQPDRFGVGTTVYVYNAMDAKLGQAPSGSPVASAVMSSTGVTFDALTDNADYVAYALVNGRHTYTSIQSRSFPKGTDTPIVRIEDLEAGKVDKSHVAVNLLDWDDADPTGNHDSTSAILAAQAEMRAQGHGAELALPGLFVMTQPLLYMGGEHYKGAGYLGTGLQFAFSSDDDCITAREPTDFTDFVRFQDMQISGDGVHTRAAIMARSSRHLELQDVQITGSSQFTQHGLWAYGQRWTDGSATSGGATASVPPKTGLTSGITAVATSLPVGDTSLYQPGPSIIKLATSVTTLAAAMGLNDTTVTLSSTSGLPASGAVMVESETIFYTGIAGNILTGCTRPSGRVSHNSGVTVYVVELVRYTGTTSTSFTGCTRGMNGTSAFAHTSGALAYQNPGDCTHLKFLGDCRIISGGVAAVRLGGTDGDVRTNSGQTNQSTLSALRASNLSQAGATAALWIEKGSQNNGLGARLIGSTGAVLKLDWFDNHLLGTTFGPPGSSSFYLVDFGTNPEAHDNDITGGFDLVGGSMAGTHNDTDCKNYVNLYRGGEHLNAFPSGIPNRTVNTRYSKGGPGGAPDGFQRWVDRNSDIHRFMGDPIPGGGRRDAMTGTTNYTTDAMTLPTNATLTVWQAWCNDDAGNIVSGAFIQIFNETDSSIVYSFASAALSQGANGGANQPVARFTGLGGKRISVRFRMTGTGPTNIVGKILFSVINGLD